MGKRSIKTRRRNRIHKKRKTKLYNSVKRKSKKHRTKRKKIKRKNNLKTISKEILYLGGQLGKNPVKCSTEELIEMGFREPDKVLSGTYSEFIEGLQSNTCSQPNTTYSEFKKFYVNNPVVVIIAHGVTKNIAPEKSSNKYIIQQTQSGYSVSTITTRVNENYEVSGHIINDIYKSIANKENDNLNLFKPDDRGNVVRNLMYMPKCLDRKGRRSKQTACQKLIPPNSIYMDISLSFHDPDEVFKHIRPGKSCILIFYNEPPINSDGIHLTLMSSEGFDNFEMTQNSKGGLHYQMFTPKDPKFTCDLSTVIQSWFKDSECTIYITSCKSFEFNSPLGTELEKLTRVISSSGNSLPIKDILLKLNSETINTGRRRKTRPLSEKVWNELKIPGNLDQFLHSIEEDDIKSKLIDIILGEYPEIYDKTLLVILVNHRPDILKNPKISSVFSGDKTVMGKAITVDPEIFRQADDRLKNNKEDALELLNINAKIYRFLSSDLQEDEEIICAALKNNYRIIVQINKDVLQSQMRDKIKECYFQSENLKLGGVGGEGRKWNITVDKDKYIELLEARRNNRRSFLEFISLPPNPKRYSEEEIQEIQQKIDKIKKSHNLAN